VIGVKSKTKLATDRLPVVYSKGLNFDFLAVNVYSVVGQT